MAPFFFDDAALDEVFNKPHRQHRPLLASSHTFDIMKAIALLVLGAAAAVLAAPRADPPQPADLCDLCKQVVSQLGDEQTMVCAFAGGARVIHQQSRRVF